MRFQHLLNLLSEPQLITATAHASIFNIISARIAGEPKREPGEGVSGSKVERPSMFTEDGVAFIPVPGVIGTKLTPMEKGSGAVDVSEIEKDLRHAEADPEASAIVLDIDSPGGMYQGTPELSEVVMGASKPVYTFTDGVMASGGLWLGVSAAAGVFSTPTATIGSIGAYTAFIDYTKHFEMHGMKMEVFTSGKYKGMGMPGTSLTDEQRELLQDRIMAINKEFRSHVNTCRPEEIDAKAMQGQTFNGREALKLGLIDGVFSSREEFKESVKAQVRSEKSR